MNCNDHELLLSHLAKINCALDEKNDEKKGKLNKIRLKL